MRHTARALHSAGQRRRGAVRSDGAGRSRGAPTVAINWTQHLVAHVREERQLRRSTHVEAAAATEEREPGGSGWQRARWARSRVAQVWRSARHQAGGSVASSRLHDGQSAGEESAKRRQRRCRTRRGGFGSGRQHKCLRRTTRGLYFIR